MMPSKTIFSCLMIIAMMVAAMVDAKDLRGGAMDLEDKSKPLYTLNTRGGLHRGLSGSGSSSGKGKGKSGSKTDKSKGKSGSDKSDKSKGKGKSGSDKSKGKSGSKSDKSEKSKSKGKSGSKSEKSKSKGKSGSKSDKSSKSKSKGKGKGKSASMSASSDSKSMSASSGSESSADCGDIDITVGDTVGDVTIIACSEVKDAPLSAMERLVVLASVPEMEATEAEATNMGATGRVAALGEAGATEDATATTTTTTDDNAPLTNRIASLTEFESF